MGYMLYSLFLPLGIGMSVLWEKNAKTRKRTTAARAKSLAANSIAREQARDFDFWDSKSENEKYIKGKTQGNERQREPERDF